MTEDDVVIILYEHFKKYGDDVACFNHLRLGTGWISEQTMDFWAMYLTPSTKFRTIGFEIKVSRSDFLKEIRDPDKRVMAMTLCDEFYFVTPKDLLTRDEIPKNCGLWEIDDQKVMEVVRGPYYCKTSAKLVCPSWPFLASVLRRQATADWRVREGRIELSEK